MPDTYNFTRGVTREQMIQRMQQAEQRVVEEIWEHRSPDVPLKTPEQLVTLASLVEKETGKPDERSRVAAVFVNRLKQNMRLQSDPTIIYGLVGGKGTLGRPIMKNEIAQPTPFNTYVINGLPPSPITNPGRASLEAAANPARTRELYFVADGTGGHIFAETYEQQQKNVARLRLIESDQKDQVAHRRADEFAVAGAGPDRELRCTASPPLRGTSKPRPRPSTDARFIERNRLGAARSSGLFRRSAAVKFGAILFRDSVGGSQSMALSSMTGFARGHGVSGPYSWAWEIKSVNGKGLDLRLRMPPGWDAIEGAGAGSGCRNADARLDASNLTVERSGAHASRSRQCGGARCDLGDDEAARAEDRASPPSLDGLLALKGVIEVSEFRGARRRAAQCRSRGHRRLCRSDRRAWRDAPS